MLSNKQKKTRTTIPRQMFPHLPAHFSGLTCECVCVCVCVCVPPWYLVTDGDLCRDDLQETFCHGTGPKNQTFHRQELDGELLIVIACYRHSYVC